MTAEAAMLALLLEKGVCKDIGGAFWVQEQKVVTLRCTYAAPELHFPSPYRVPGYNRG